jgi:DNA-binding NarL/FixJ family response regulator
MRVVLVDDQQSFRDSLKIALWHEARISVVAHGNTARQLYPVIDEQKPDLVISDLILKDTDGISAVRELQRRGCQTRMLILTNHTSTLFVNDAFRAGAHGYALKEQPLAEIIEAMRLVRSGERYVSPLLQQVGRAPAVTRPPEAGNGNGNGAFGVDKLSAREREVFCQILQGVSSRDIARALCISLKTVETHRLHINRKLGVHSPAELIRLAALAGLVTA